MSLYTTIPTQYSNVREKPYLYKIISLYHPKKIELSTYTDCNCIIRTHHGCFVQDNMGNTTAAVFLYSVVLQCIISSDNMPNITAYKGVLFLLDSLFRMNNKHLNEGSAFNLFNIIVCTQERDRERERETIQHSQR